MRPSCLNCSRKHIAQAEVLMAEARKGYIQHGWLAVGHMAEAEDELLEKYQEIADKIREERLKYMDSLNNFGDESYIENLYDFPSLDLIQELTILAMEELNESVEVNDDISEQTEDIENS